MAIALAFWADSGQQVSARPNSPDECQFVDGFLAFRELLGEDIVGECEHDASYDWFGNARQPTTEGTLFWQATRNEVSFHNGFQQWVSGPSGLHADVTLGGLSEPDTHRDNVTVPAILLFDAAPLVPWDLGEDWDFGEVSPSIPISVQFGCFPHRVSEAYGSTTIWLVNARTGVAAAHYLEALPDFAIERTRRQHAEEQAACNGWTEHSSQGDYTLHMREAPFLALGDEAVLYEFGIVNERSGERRVQRSASVRYGGLWSTVVVRMPDGSTDEDQLNSLEWLSRMAHKHIQEVAWYLRP
ncbi:MAG: hypothetical protein AB7P40_14870 [Chloroflexota bacterium]